MQTNLPELILSDQAISRTRHGFAGVVLVACLAVLLGYQLDTDVLYRPILDGSATHPLTALTSLLIAAALLSERRFPMLQKGLVWGALVICLLNLVAEDFLSQITPFQSVVSRELAASLKNSMGMNTTLMLGWAAISLLVIHQGLHAIGQFLVFVTLANPSVSLLGYAYGLEGFYGEMSILTSFFGLSLVLSILLLTTRNGVLHGFLVKSPTGAVARMQLLASIVVPTAIGYFILLIANTGFAVISLIAVVTVLFIWFAVAMVGVSNKRLRKAEALNLRLLAEAETHQQALAHSNQALEQSNEELDRFAYIASHDLRAPLRTIDAMTQFLEEDIGEKLEGNSREFMRLIRSRVGRLDNLLTDLLAYSRVGRKEGKAEWLDLEEVVRHNAELYLPEDRFTLLIETPLPKLFVPKAQLDLVCRNLLMNAVKHHDRPEGNVTVSAEQNDHETVITFSDDGPGIAPEFHERIFEMFSTLKPRDEVEGSGMGLALVKKSMQSVQGDVDIVPGEGRGAQFRLIYPAAASSFAGGQQ